MRDPIIYPGEPILMCPNQIEEHAKRIRPELLDVVLSALDTTRGDA